MQILLMISVASLFLTTTLAWAQPDIRQEQIEFEKGTSGAAIKGEIKGSQIVDYQLRASEGQWMVAVFEPSNPSAYFNVMPPDAPAAIFIGSTAGNRFEGALPADGVYTLRIYLMRNAARRHETASYTLEVEITGKRQKGAVASNASSVADASFDQTLNLQGIQFRVTSAVEDGGNTLRIAPVGLEIDNSPIVRAIDGRVIGADVADLNADGSPEIYVYVASEGRESRGSLVAYAANRRKSLSEIYLPPMTQHKAASKGYRGGDEFAVVESVLAQRFPVYRNADATAKPTGGMRQLQYKLVPGEAGWLLKVDRVVEY